jgi:hypothetical protein
MYIYILSQSFFFFLNFRRACEVFNFFDSHGGPMEVTYLEKNESKFGRQLT